jgi:putative endonuclease
MEFNKRSSGSKGESLAIQFLEKKGYEILDRNFHYSRKGEIDIIARDRKRNTIVFIEVKSGNPSSYGDLIEKITPAKVKQVRSLAEAYLHIKKIRNQYVRFDVVLVEFGKSDARIRHIEDAF